MKKWFEKVRKVSVALQINTKQRDSDKIWTQGFFASPALFTVYFAVEMPRFS